MEPCCARETSRHDLKDDLAPRMPAFYERVRSLDVFERENEGNDVLVP